MSSESYLIAERVGVRLGGRRVLTEISFSLPRSCLVALVGPNGAGKTTLLRGLAGLLPLDGAVRVGTDVVAQLAARERAKRFAYLPQGHVVHWPLPVRDIVALGRYPHGTTDPARLTAHDAEAVERALTMTDAGALAARPITEISGGERSRAILARVLAVEAPIILADEPMASLDPRYQIEVMRLLRQAAQSGTLVIVVTHDLGLAARFADTVMVLHDGHLIAAASPEHALAPRLLRDVFRIEAFRGERDGKPILVPWAPT